MHAERTLSTINWALPHSTTRPSHKPNAQRRAGSRPAGFGDEQVSRRPSFPDGAGLDSGGCRARSCGEQEPRRGCRLRDQPELRPSPPPARGGSTRRSSMACSRSTAATRPERWHADGCGAHAGSDAFRRAEWQSGQSPSPREVISNSTAYGAPNGRSRTPRHGSSTPAHYSSSARPCDARDDDPVARSFAPRSAYRSARWWPNSA